MARPSRWDEYETALLVEAYIKVTENGGVKTRVLQELSDNLRQMAVNKGIEIDDVYRNLNGMMWQYTFIEKAFKKSGFGQHFPAKVFRYVVKLYLYNRKKFDEILKEAKKRIDLSDVRASIDEHVFQKEMRMILQRHYAYGYRINSSIELNRFKNFAEMDGVVLPDSDERIKAEIRNVGYLIEDKVYIISDEILSYLSMELCKLYEEGHRVFFYECIFSRYQDFMEENHISSEDMLKEILKQSNKRVLAEYKGMYFAKNYVSFQGQTTENEAVTGEIIRCWGNTPVRESDSFSEELPYIPEDLIKRYLSMGRKFAWVSEGVYVLVDRLIISQQEEKDIYDYVWNACEINGFASISEIPLGNLIEENYELTFVGLLAAIYNKVLFGDFYLNGKIITKEKSDLDVVALVKVFLNDKQTCTFDMANQKVTELAGGKYRYMAYHALYDSLVRIDKDNYVDDSMVVFNIDDIDRILADIIADRGFIAVKEVTTFALFPVCNYAWNHYLLESYCYRFSVKYSLRYRMLNDKNAGIIAEKTISDGYDDILAKAVARADVPLQPEIVGKYLVDTGYTAKKRFAGLENVIEKAALIREEK